MHAIAYAESLHVLLTFLLDFLTNLVLNISGFSYFAVVFTILNSLQGFFIFISFVLGDKRTRIEAQKALWRLTVNILLHAQFMLTSLICAIDFKQWKSLLNDKLSWCLMI